MNDPVKIEEARATLEKHLADNPNVLSVGTGRLDQNIQVLYIFLHCDPAIFKLSNNLEEDGWEGYHVRVRGRIVAA